MCSDFLRSFCLKHLILRRTEQDIMRNLRTVHFHVKYPLFLSYILKKKNLNFLENFWKILKNQISRNSVQCDLSCFMRRYGRAERQTDMTKQIAAFRNSANAPANEMSKETHLTLYEKYFKINSSSFV
jgi:hypothetical protein